MKAFVINNFGAPKSFHRADLPKPELLPNHVCSLENLYRLSNMFFTLAAKNFQTGDDYRIVQLKHEHLKYVDTPILPK
jgi:hypothetical protein